MASITYIPDPGDPAEVPWGRFRFPANKAVQVDDPAIIRKAQGNRFFKVSGVTTQEQQQAEVIGTMRDANTGRDVRLIAMPAAPVYGGGGGGAPTGPTPPTAATQGSAATLAAAPRTGGPDPDAFARNVGAENAAELASGEYEGAPEYLGPEGTEGASGKPARGSKARK